MDWSKQVSHRQMANLMREAECLIKTCAKPPKTTSEIMSLIEELNLYGQIFYDDDDTWEALQAKKFKLFKLLNEMPDNGPATSGSTSDRQNNNQDDLVNCNGDSTVVLENEEISRGAYCQLFYPDRGQFFNGFWPWIRTNQVGSDKSTFGQTDNGPTPATANKEQELLGDSLDPKACFIAAEENDNNDDHAIIEAEEKVDILKEEKPKEVVLVERDACKDNVIEYIIGEDKASTAGDNGQDNSAEIFAATDDSSSVKLNIQPDLVIQPHQTATVVFPTIGSNNLASSWCGPIVSFSHQSPPQSNQNIDITQLPEVGVMVENINGWNRTDNSGDAKDEAETVKTKENGKYLPRAILVHLEPRTMDSVSSGDQELEQSDVKKAQADVSQTTKNYGDDITSVMLEGERGTFRDSVETKNLTNVYAAGDATKEHNKKMLDYWTPLPPTIGVG